MGQFENGYIFVNTQQEKDQIPLKPEQKSGYFQLSMHNNIFSCDVFLFTKQQFIYKK